MDARLFYTKFWDDSFIRELTPNEKLLFVYYLTNPRINIIHCYECSTSTTSYETGIPIEEVKKANDKFSKANKILFRNGLVYLVNAVRYQKYEGEKNEIHKQRLWLRMGTKNLAWFNQMREKNDQLTGL